MGFARVNDDLLLHGSTGSRLMRRIGSGIPICVEVTILDGLVLAKSSFESSMNYRSAVVFGKGKLSGADSCAVAVISTPPGTSRLDKIMVVSPNASRAMFMAARALGAKNF